MRTSSAAFLQIVCKIIKVIIKSSKDRDDNFWRNSHAFMGEQRDRSTLVLGQTKKKNQILGKIINRLVPLNIHNWQLCGKDTEIPITNINKTLIVGHLF